MHFRKLFQSSASVVMLLCAVSVMAKPWVDVYPTGVYPDDVKNVQAAINSLGDGVSGTIMLKAYSKHGVATAFNFGTSMDPAERSGVEPVARWTGALEIAGERMRGARTVIEGGIRPISSHRQDAINIRNIEFRGAWESAIAVYTSASVDIQHNTVTDTFVISHDVFNPQPVRPIAVFPSVRFLPDLPPGAFVGRVSITNNTVVGGSGGLSQGIVSYVSDANVTVTNNTVSDVNVGVELQDYRHGVLVLNNTLHVKAERNYLFAAGVLLTPGRGESAVATVASNTILVADDEGTGFTAGVLGAADDGAGGDIRNSVIVGNVVTMKQGDNGIALYINGNNRLISGNIISRNSVAGSLAKGVVLEQFSGHGRIQDNHVTRNQLAGMSPASAEAHIWLGTVSSGTVVLAHSDDVVVDNGRNNLVLRAPR